MSRKKTKRSTKAPYQLLLKTAIGLAAILIVSTIGSSLFNLYMTKQHDIKEKKLAMTKFPPDVKGQMAKSASDIKIPILVYHYVEFVQDRKDTTRQSLNTLPYVLDQQLTTLKENGYTFITPSQLMDIMAGIREKPEHPLILSFDDGYRDFYTDVLPILKKHKAHAVAYIVPGFLDKPNYLFTWQLREINKIGLVEIGAHTMHHVYMKGMDPKTMYEEVGESKRILERLTGQSVVSFAYPYGAFDTAAIEAVKASGFTNAVSTIEGNMANDANRYFLFRIHPGAFKGDELITSIEGTFAH